MPFRIGIVPDPLNHPDWPKMEAFLRPSAEYGGVAMDDEPHIAVWAVYDGDELAGVASARLTTDKIGEVPLVGGRNAHRWIVELSETMGRCMADHGMKAMRAYGRKGWRKMLEACGWEVIGTVGKFTAYERGL